MLAFTRVELRDGEIGAKLVIDFRVLAGGPNKRLIVSDYHFWVDTRLLVEVLVDFGFDLEQSLDFFAFVVQQNGAGHYGQALVISLTTACSVREHEM